MKLLVGDVIERPRDLELLGLQGDQRADVRVGVIVAAFLDGNEALALSVLVAFLVRLDQVAEKLAVEFVASAGGLATGVG